MRVALIGYGAVASIHAHRLNGHAEVIIVVGPDESKAKAFAQVHDIPNVGTDVKAAFARSDAVIICSPSPNHFEHAKQAVESGVNTLIELPACSSADQAEMLDALARARNLVVQCAHTSRYCVPYQQITKWIGTGLLGDIQHVNYVRCIPPRIRSWVDDALFHHAEHPLDLFLHWFGSVKALGCVAHPQIPGSQDLCLLASVCNHAPATVCISYTSRLPEVKMTLIGANHTVATDGFTYIDSDEPNLRWRHDRQNVYEAAIEQQDISFLDACRSGKGGIQWSETIKLTRCVEEFANKWSR